MSLVIRKYVPLAVTAILGFFMILSFPIDNKQIAGVSTMFGTWVMLLASFALGLGAINIIVIHGKNTAKREKGQWLFSVALLATFAFVALLGFAYDVKSKSYTYVYDILIGAGTLSLSSLRGFFTFSAFYRSFRTRTIEAGVLMIGCILVLMYAEPIAELVLPQLNVFTKWMLDVPYVGGTRAIAVIGGIALFLMSLRVIMGIDKTWMGKEE